jgi:hypothetical protein
MYCDNFTLLGIISALAVFVLTLTAMSRNPNASERSSVRHDTGTHHDHMVFRS